MINAKHDHPKALLIDDDRVFGTIMREVAKANGVELDYFESLTDLGSFGFMGKYNLILCDYFLDKLNGHEVAEYVDVFFKNTPVVIVSADETLSDGEKTKGWPTCIKGFIHKRERPDQLLDKALAFAGYA